MELTEQVDLCRIEATSHLDSSRRAELGQYMTPAAVARFMASLFDDPAGEIRLLDAGAGVGSLTAAFIEDACLRTIQPASLSATVYEIDPVLIEYLNGTLRECDRFCRAHSIPFSAQLIAEDFIKAGVRSIRDSLGLFATQTDRFNRVILNPPYKKIHSSSEHRRLLSLIGMETTNLYTGFLAIVIHLLEPGGELVAITPRSFCNGPYFKPFRALLLEHTALRRIHVFEKRDQAFSDDAVLQENVIFHAIKAGERKSVTISSSAGPEDLVPTLRELEYDQVVRPGDPDFFIHVATNGTDQRVADQLKNFPHRLADLGLEVSTGRVVDFRAAAALRAMPEESTAPLIYPTHFHQGCIEWPKPGSKKPNALVSDESTASLLMPAGYYVLVKRFSAKEEPRRIVAALYNPARLPDPRVGFENHINVFHRHGQGLPESLARGLVVYLNSTLVDKYFRQFSGHTQVNATDLRTLPYPDPETLLRLAQTFEENLPSQEAIDHLLKQEVQRMDSPHQTDPVDIEKKIKEALEILKQLGFPRGQLNERSALALLALIDLKPEASWAEARMRMIGITPIMEFCSQYYGRDYAPNSRETFRRFTMHQFVDAGLAIENPDEPGRPVNSPKYCYQIESGILELLKAYGTEAWESRLNIYLASVQTLKEQYARYRSMHLVPVKLPGSEIQLTPGKHNELIKAIIEEFAPRFAPGAEVVYIGDTGEKWGFFDKELLAALGVTIDSHGKMPDVVLYHREKDWLLLVEAVTSHGPVDSKRRGELAGLFKSARPGIVYVTAFLTRNDMARYLTEISWETEVWVKDAPTHLIHFDGERYLGPYESEEK